MAHTEDAPHPLLNILDLDVDEEIEKKMIAELNPPSDTENNPRWTEEIHKDYIEHIDDETWSPI